MCDVRSAESNVILKYKKKKGEFLKYKTIVIFSLMYRIYTKNTFFKSDLFKRYQFRQFISYCLFSC